MAYDRKIGAPTAPSIPLLYTFLYTSEEGLRSMPPYPTFDYIFPHISKKFPKNFQNFKKSGVGASIYLYLYPTNTFRYPPPSTQCSIGIHLACVNKLKINEQSIFDVL